MNNQIVLSTMYCEVTSSVLASSISYDCLKKSVVDVKQIFLIKI